MALFFRFFYLSLQLLLLLKKGNSKGIVLLLKAVFWPIKNLKRIQKKRLVVKNMRKVSDQQLMKNGLLLTAKKTMNLLRHGQSLPTNEWGQTSELRESFMMRVLKQLPNSKLCSLLVSIIKSMRLTTMGKLFGMFERNYTVLDLGCGETSPIAKLGGFAYSVGVDISTSSLHKNKSKRYLNDYVRADLCHLPFRNHAFDCVLAFDVVEHFQKENGFQFIRQTEEISKNMLVIQTPNGYCPTPYATNIYDSHKSSWYTGDFENVGFVVLGRHGLKRLRGLRGKPILRPRIVGETVSILSQLILFSRPNLCFHLLAFKVKAQ